MSALVTASLALALAAGPDGQTRPWLAVEYEVAPGWHVYWENPGDSGMATSAELTLPPGVSTPGPRFPGPDRWTAPGDIAVFGYEGHAALLFPLELASPGLTGPVQVETRWLACRDDRCIPGEAALSAQLGPTPPAPDGALQTAFERLPRTVAAPALPTEAGKWRVPVGAGEVVDVFPVGAIEARVAGWRADAANGAVEVDLRAPQAVMWGEDAPARLVVKLKHGQEFRYVEAIPAGL